MASRNDILEDFRSHFNEPVLIYPDIGRVIGYGEDGIDCYLIIKRSSPHDDIIWHTAVGGYFFLGCLRNQGYVKAYNGEDWTDLTRLESLLEGRGLTEEKEFLVEIRDE